MKSPRAILIFSVILNLALATAAVVLFGRSPAAPTAQGEHVTTLTIVVTQMQFSTNLQTEVAARASDEAFHWSAIRSTNLAEFVASLRAMDCPALTIRDIISGELDELFAPRMIAVIDPLRPQFWQLIANLRANEKILEEKFETLKELGEERDDLLTELTGSETADAAANQRAAERSLRRYDYLPTEKRERMVALAGEYSEKSSQLRQELRGKPKEEYREKHAALELEFENARKELLTTDEFEEYQLRQSDFASLRYNVTMGGFNPDEIRTLVKLQDDIARAQPLPDDKDPGFQESKTERQAKMNEEIKNFLGEEKFAEFARAQDGDFLQFFHVTEQFGLPHEAAVSAYEIRRTATTQAEELQRNETFTPDEREVLLDVLMDETHRALTETLGEKAARNYFKHNDSWLMRLAENQ
jgi:hypothetical protein